MDQPKFKHDCPNCRFLGHFFGHDVYICPDQKDCYTTLLARRGDEPHQYGSVILSAFQKQCRDPEHRIGGDGMETMPYQDFLFSEHAEDFHRAWVLALASYPDIFNHMRGEK